MLEMSPKGKQWGRKGERWHTGNLKPRRNWIVKFAGWSTRESLPNQLSYGNWDSIFCKGKQEMVKLRIIVGIFSKKAFPSGCFYFFK